MLTYKTEYERTSYVFEDLYHDDFVDYPLSLETGPIDLNLTLPELIESLENTKAL